MLYIKLAARKSLEGSIIKHILLHISCVLMKAAAFICFLYPAMSLFYESSVLFSGIKFLENNRYLSGLTLAFMVFAGISIFLAAAGIKFYSEAEYFYITGENQFCPVKFLCLRQSLRYIKYRLAVMALKLAGIFFFYFPAAAVTAGTFIYLRKNTMIKEMFWVLVFTAAVFFAGGTVFYRLFSAKYFLCPYLLYLNPMQSVREVIFSSVLLTEGRRREIFIMNMNILPWKYASYIIFIKPFSECYIKSIRAFMCRRLYEENSVS